MYTAKEKKIFSKLNTPQKIQDFLNNLKFNFEEKKETCMSPRKVLQTKKAHCMEGALFAAAVLEFHNQKPLILDLRSIKNDDDHVLSLFKRFDHWGAISKTNHAVLRYREPIYKTIRELVLSYFHEYFLKSGKKTLREYSDPFDLSKLPKLKSGNWRTSERDLFEIPKILDQSYHHKLLSNAQIKNLRKADAIEIKAGEIVEYKK